jgi:hypothetical protein
MPEDSVLRSENQRFGLFYKLAHLIQINNLITTASANQNPYLMTAIPHFGYRDLMRVCFFSKTITSLDATKFE